MKKLLCLSFVLFATTMSFSAAAKADRVETRLDLILPTTLRDMPTPDLGCKNPPPCPPPPVNF